MIIDEEVKTALDTLRRHATGNEFELHRIDILERDLTSPPVAEVIDDKTQVFNDTIYHKGKHGYYVSQKSLHRSAWEYYFGKAPYELQVHHRNTNKDDNDISNLELLENPEHQALHNRTTRKKEYVCLNCGKKFFSSAPVPPRFCSQHCKGSWKYKNEREIRTCSVCGENFSAYKRSKTKCCSRKCAAQITAQKNKASHHKI